MSTLYNASLAFKTVPMLLLLLLLASCINLTSAASPPRLKRDGVADISGFPGVNYQAVNYLPVCGTLSLTKTDQYEYFTTVATCDASMSVYNTTARTSAVYDYTGVLSDVQVGTGTPLCMCFSLGGAQGRMDMCINILGDGTPEGRPSGGWGDDIVGGTFVPDSNKALPRCNDVNVPSISSSVYASLADKQAQQSDPPSPPTALTSNVTFTPTNGSMTLAFAAFIPWSTAAESANVTNQTGTDKSGKDDDIALGVGLGM
ncbi:MAG: hypothetical protein Q9225_007593, partial [Loekoesia sp. 1 TL-2023]